MDRLYINEGAAMNIYERMEEIIRNGEASKKGRLLYGFIFDYDGLIDEYCWKLDSGMEDFIFYTMEELEEFVNANWIKEGE